MAHRLAISSAKTIEAMDLINDLLDIEKFEQSTLELSFEPEAVGELIELSAKHLSKHKVAN